MSTFARRIRPHVRRELDDARSAERRGDRLGARRHLERAHVLGQAATGEHVRVHIAMCRIAVRERECAAAWGQLWRAAAALLLTPLGMLPTGNTGGSDVSAFRAMPIARDLRDLIDAARR